MAKARGSNGRFVSSKQAELGQRMVAAAHELNGLVANATLTRTNLIRRLLDERRDIDDECGYPKDVTAAQYKILYDRESIATRVVQVWPKECWKVLPSVYEDEDPNTETTFEAAWKELGKSLRGDSWYEGEEGNPVWEFLYRIDELSGIGAYGVLLIGFNDGEDMSQPVVPREGMEVLYIRAFDESLVDIGSYEMDRASPRYGWPNKYTVTLNDPNDQLSGSGTGLQLATIDVHWSRIIHVADNLGSSEIFGVPRIRPVYNRCSDLRKLYGGSAEMFWQGAFPGISFEQMPQAADIEVGDDMREAIEKYMNSLQRYIALEGFSAKSLAPQVADPSAHIDKEIEAICIQLAIPKRIFMGSERGELASGQDDDTWNDRVAFRQNRYVTPRIIVPFIDRLIQVGVLPEPEQYRVEWPDLNKQTDEEKTAVGARATEALVKYVGGNGDAVIEPVSWLTKVMGWTDEDAQAAIDSTVEYHENPVLEEEEEEDELDRAMREQELERKKAEVDQIRGGNNAQPEEE